MHIDISYETDVKLHIAYKKIIEEMILASLDYENCPYEVEVSVSIVNDTYIRELNKTYRDMDKSTDVLSFPLNDYKSPSDFDTLDDTAFNPETGELMLGDIVISAEHTIVQALEYGHSRKRELAFLVVHSMLHLFGYDHIEDDERLVMEAKQEEILRLHNYIRK